MALFKANWSQLVSGSNYTCKLALPFFHLRSEGFWTLVAREGNDSQLLLSSSISSITRLDSLVEYALMDEVLFYLMRQEEENAILQEVLMRTYFPGRHENPNSIAVEYQSLLAVGKSKIIEDPTDYQKEIEALLAKKDEEELFFRGSLFKKEIPKIYHNACCISGLRIDSTLNLSMIDACHIRPFSESHDDTITNGIALCPNLHRAFDRGLISISNEYRVLVSSAFTENDTPYGMKQFEGKPIALPTNQAHWPLQENLEWHRVRVFRG